MFVNVNKAVSKIDCKKEHLQCALKSSLHKYWIYEEDGENCQCRIPQPPSKQTSLYIKFDINLGHDHFHQSWHHERAYMGHATPAPKKDPYAP